MDSCAIEKKSDQLLGSKLACAGCGQSDAKQMYSALSIDDHQTRYDLLRCGNCDLITTTPEPSEAVLEKAYDPDYYGERESKFNPAIEAWTKFAARSRAERLLRHYAGKRPEKLKILDIGCGRGVLLRGFAQIGHDAVGLERAGSPFSSLPNIRTGSVDDLVAQGEQFDMVVIWHVLEHLPNPKAVLLASQNLIKAGGVLIIAVPNAGSRQARIFKARWFHLDLPRHLFHFGDSALRKMVAVAGFRVRAKSTFSIDQNLFGFIQSTLNYIPMLSDGHLYSLLKSKFSVRVALILLLYLPVLIPVTLFGLLELLVSHASDDGAELFFACEKGCDDK